MSPDIWNDPGLRPRPVDHAALSPVSFLTRAARAFPRPAGHCLRQPPQDLERARPDLPAVRLALRRGRIGRDDGVALLMANTPPTLAACFAVPTADAVLNTINIRLDTDTVAYILQHCEARLLIADAEWLPVMREALATLASPPRLTVYADEAAGFTPVKRRGGLR